MIRLPLDDQGEIFLKATVTNIYVPGWFELAHSVGRSVLPAFVKKEMAELPQTLSRLWNNHLRPFASFAEWPSILRQAQRSA